MLGFFLGLSSVSLGIASMFWWLGATLVMPFAWLEVLAVGVALLVHARHVTDRESIRLQGGVLTVERACGPRTERCEFCTEWVRVEPAQADGSLIELSERGEDSGGGALRAPRAAPAARRRDAVGAAATWSSAGARARCGLSGIIKLT